MKKWLFIGLMTAVCCSGYSQTEKGKFLVGGNFDIGSTIQGSDNKFSMGIRPSVGFFPVKNFVLGGSYSFTINSDPTEKTQTYISGIGPFFKYYFGKKAMKGFAGTHGGYQVFTRIKDGDTFNRNGFYFGFNLGIAYFLNDFVALESSLYSHTAGYEKFLPVTRIGVGIGFVCLLKKRETP